MIKIKSTPTPTRGRIIKDGWPAEAVKLGNTLIIGTAIVIVVFLALYIKG
jgi:hypothetical protein